MKIKMLELLCNLRLCFEIQSCERNNKKYFFSDIFLIMQSISLIALFLLNFYLSSSDNPTRRLF